MRFNRGLADTCKVQNHRSTNRKVRMKEKKLLFGLVLTLGSISSLFGQPSGIQSGSGIFSIAFADMVVTAIPLAAAFVLLFFVRRNMQPLHRRGLDLTILVFVTVGGLFLIRQTSVFLSTTIGIVVAVALALLLVVGTIGLVTFFIQLARNTDSADLERLVDNRTVELRELNRRLELEIESRKIAEKEVAKREKKFRLLIENISDGIVLNDENSNVIYQSPSVTRILGYTMEERKGKPVLNYVHEGDKPKFLKLYEDLASTPGQPLPFQLRFRHREGHYIWLEGVVTNLLHDRNVNGYIANYRDISERKRAEEKLNQERYLLRTLIDNLPVYIYIKDTELRHVINNKENVELIGAHSEEETLGKTVLDYFSADVARKFMEADHKVLSSGKPIIDLEEKITNKAGEERWLLTSKIPLVENEIVVGLIGISRDITDRKNAELLLQELNKSLTRQTEKLAASNAELERFAYVASHDLQEPLRMVRSFLHLLKRRFESMNDVEANQYIDFAVDGAERMKQLISDLLEYSRLGAVNERREPIDTNELVQRTAEMMRPAMAEAGLRLTVNMLPSIVAAKTQMSQVFQNLISNAIKYRSDDQPYIVIDGRDEATHWLFSVSDNGIGIDPRFVDKIFEIFQRLNLDGQRQGSGIGLAICKRIVEGHGGQIWVEPSEGAGSTFYFTIEKPVDMEP